MLHFCGSAVVYWHSKYAGVVNPLLASLLTAKSRWSDGWEMRCWSASCKSKERKIASTPTSLEVFSATQNSKFSEEDGSDGSARVALLSDHLGCECAGGACTISLLFR